MTAFSFDFFFVARRSRTSIAVSITIGHVITREEKNFYAPRHCRLVVGGRLVSSGHDVAHTEHINRARTTESQRRDLSREQAA